MKGLKQIFRIFLLITWIFFFCIINAEAKKIVPKVIDSFNSVNGWKIISEGLKINKKKGIKDNCICLDYDLEGNREWVVISKKFKGLKLPQNYKISFYIKGTGKNNNLEFKLIDNKGNVFWKKWEYYKFLNKWKKVVLKKSDITYAWGPNPGIKLSKVDKMEIAISRGLGGKGKVYLDELSLQTSYEKEETMISEIKVKASSCQEEGHKAEYVVDGNKQTRWSSGFSDPQWIQIDLGKIKELAGLNIYWETAYGKVYDILLSKDGKKWNKVYETSDGDGGTDDIYFKKSKARYIKLYGKKRGTAWGYSIYEMSIKKPDEQPIITASSSLEKYKPVNILDGNMKTKWKTKSIKNQWVKIDLRKIKTFGGIFLYWDKNYAHTYEISTSIDGEEWKPAYLMKKGNGGSDMVYFNKTAAQFIKISFIKGINKKGYTLKEITVKGPDEFLTTQKYYEISAKESPRGYFPRWIYKEQAFWTIVGVPDDFNESLLCEDGSIEPYKSNFSIMPFLYQNKKLITWADVKLSQSLEKGYLPIPTVKWDYKDIALTVKTFTYGDPGESITYTWYRIKNKGKKVVKGKFFLTFRPFQINPIWQPGGGLAEIRDIKMQNNKIEVNRKYIVLPLTKPDNMGAGAYKKEDVVYVIEKGKVPVDKKIRDDDKHASGVIEYKYNLKPGKTKDVFLAMPLHQKKPDLNIKMKTTKIKKEFEKMMKKTISFWEAIVNKIEINIPDSSIVNTLRANIAYILINRDGPAVQPGSRTYESAWIRDGSMTCSALLKMGITKPVKEYLNWYSGFIRKNGEVPALINRTGTKFYPTPLKEYDAQGELIFSILQYYYFTGDTKFLEEKLPVIIQALKYLEYLRDKRISGKYKDDPKMKRFYGILPNSVSHEGYFPEPGMHSFWDDFFGLKGWKDGITIAKILGRDDLLPWMILEEKELRESVYKSIKLTMKEKNINYIPGCAEKGDFDATSTAIAVMICDELKYLPQPQLQNTFDKYYNDLVGRFKPDWVGGFTPYEIRSVQAYLYMNQKKRALTLLEYLLGCRYPSNWNHLAEVVFSDPRLGQYIGDMPHTWVGSGYINAVRSMFVYENEENNSVILGAGIDENWLKRKEGISIKKFPTFYGDINFSMRKNKGVLKIKVWGDAKPDKGFVFKSPYLKKKIKRVKINGEKWAKYSKDQVIFYKLPAEISIKY